MTMSAKLVNTSNWQHETVEVEINGDETHRTTLAPGEMMGIPIPHDNTKHNGERGAETTIKVCQRVCAEPVPFQMNGVQVVPGVAVKVEPCRNTRNPFDVG